ncbi:MAG: hypothetical protein AAB359_01865, partial [Elusimicrobiota bacterium]
KTFAKDVNLFLSLPIVNTLYGSEVDLSNPGGAPYPTDPDALSAYKDFVKTIVGRYSDQIKYWMVGQNEFDDLNPLAVNWKAYSEEGLNAMIEYTKTACSAIQEACPDCRAVLGGSVVPMLSFSKKGEEIPTPDGTDHPRAVKDGLYTKLVPAVTKSCKNMAIDYHFWYKSDKKDYRVQRKIIDKIRKIAPGLEIWNTETGTIDGMHGITEFEQARDIVRLYVYALSYGQKKIFWTNTLEYNWTADDSSVFDYMGLINNPKNNDGLSHKKLSYYTYKKMVEMLEGSDWNKIQTITERDDIYVYKFLKNGKAVWVAWNDSDGEKDITIAGIRSSTVRITESVPNYTSGKDVKDYSTAFSTKKAAAKDALVKLKIGDTPVFIESGPYE